MSVRSTAFIRAKMRTASRKRRCCYIDPEVCIDCGACEPACPVQAIFPQDLVPAQWAQYTAINADWYKTKA